MEKMEEISSMLEEVEKEIVTTKERYLREIKELEMTLKQNFEKNGYNSISDWVKDIKNKKEEFEKEMEIIDRFSPMLPVNKISSIYFMIKAYTLLKDNETEKGVDVKFLETVEKEAKEIIEKVKKYDQKFLENVCKINEITIRRIKKDPLREDEMEKTLDECLKLYENLESVEEKINRFVKSVRKSSDFEKLISDVSDLLGIPPEDLIFLLENSPSPRILEKNTQRYHEIYSRLKEKMKEEYCRYLGKEEKTYEKIFERYEILKKCIENDAKNINKKLKDLEKTIKEYNSDILKKLSETVLSEHSTINTFPFNFWFNVLWDKNKGDPDKIYSSMIDNFNKLIELKDELVNCPFREVKEYLEKELNISNTDELVGIFSKLRKKETLKKLNNEEMEKYVVYRICWFIYHSEDPLSVVDKLGEKEKELFFRMISEKYGDSDNYKKYREYDERCYELERKLKEIYNVSSPLLEKEMKHFENYKRVLEANVEYLRRELKKAMDKINKIIERHSSRKDETPEPSIIDNTPLAKY